MRRHRSLLLVTLSGALACAQSTTTTPEPSAPASPMAPYEAMFAGAADPNATPSSIYGTWGSGDTVRIDVEPDSVTVAAKCNADLSGARAAASVSSSAVSVRESATVLHSMPSSGETTFMNSSGPCQWALSLGDVWDYMFVGDGLRMTFKTGPFANFSFLKIKDSSAAPPAQMPTAMTRVGHYHGTYLGYRSGAVDLDVHDDGTFGLVVGADHLDGALDGSNAFSGYGTGGTMFEGSLSMTSGAWQASGTWDDLTGKGTWSAAHQ